MIDDPSKYNEYSAADLYTAITVAITKDSLEDIEYIFTSPFVQNRHEINIHFNKEHFLELACEYGRLNIVKYLLTSPNLKEHCDIAANNNYCFQMACMKGHIDIVKYMAASPELKTHSNVLDANNYALQLACQNNYVEVVSYLLTSPDLKSHPNMNDSSHASFKLASFKNNLDVLQYLIFDYHIEKTDHIKSVMKYYPNSEVEEMFKLRDLHDELNKELNIKNSQDKRLKM
jgi:ankyrin repeat protein